MYTYVGPPAPPIVTMGTMTDNSIQILWQGEDSTPCGSTTYYVKLVVSANEQLITQDTTLNTFYVFTGLSPNTFYTASVYGSNQAGDGDTTILRIQIMNSGMFDTNNQQWYCLSS